MCTTHPADDTTSTDWMEAKPSGPGWACSHTEHRRRSSFSVQSKSDEGACDVTVPVPVLTASSPRVPAGSG
jgi:hypothetical protein